MAIAAGQNAKHQEATEYGESLMKRVRDEENCFRIVELGIPAGDVVVFCKPSLEYTSSGEPHIVLGDPQRSEDFGEQRYYFRILKGHTIENLLKMRKITH